MTHSFTRALTRRHFIGSGVALGAVSAFGSPAHAISQSAATAHVDGLVAEVNAVIASGQSEAQMLTRFEGIFDRYADVPTIAGYVLGVERRNASAAQLSAFTASYKTYVARKYGRRFREFIGGAIEVRGARDLPRGVEVQTVAVLVGQSPFEVDFHVEDSRGRPLFFNIVIEGINMLLSERAEVLAMLDARGGDLNRLIAELPQT
jgi:phospholipid transport system substrate-binding protein